MANLKDLRHSLLVLLATAGSAATAADPLLEHPLGGGFLWASELRIGGTYTDNMYYSPAQSNQIEAVGMLVEPTLKITRESDEFRVGLYAHGEYASFDLPDSVDDYFDADVRGEVEVQSSVRHRFMLMGIHRWDHDPFGTERTEGSVLARRELDEWTQAGGEFRYRYGAPAAKINAEFRVSESSREYTTSRADTAFLNSDVTELEYLLFYNVSPKTAMLFNVVRRDLRFEREAIGGVDRDGEDVRLRAGVRWLASAKTSGDVRLGYATREFDDPGRPAIERFDWLASLNWVPVSRTALTLQTGRVEVPSYLAGARLINTSYYALSWRQDWTYRLSSDFNVRLTEHDFVDLGRQDDAFRTQLELQYQAMRSLNLLSRLEYNSRESNRVNRDFDRFGAYLGIGISP